MAIRVGREPASGQPTVTFILAGDADPGVTSVVGSFNDWTPGVHTLVPADQDAVSVTVTIVDDGDIHFRYLRSGGVWFDDPEADETTAHGSIISSTRFTARPEESAEVDAPRDETAPGSTDSADSFPPASTPRPRRAKQLSSG
jgi:hypothetical protein